MSDDVLLKLLFAEPAEATARRGWHGFAVRTGATGSCGGRGPRRKEPKVERPPTGHLRPASAELLGRIARGERLREREKRGLRLGERLAVQRAEREALHSMSPEERTLAYRRGQLSGYQLSVWWSHYSHEIPRIDDVPEWIAATLVDVCEHPDYIGRCWRQRADRLTGRPK
jgi:hypothetical protein